MNYFFAFIVALVLLCESAFGAPPPPYARNQFSTNAEPTAYSSANFTFGRDLNITSNLNVTGTSLISTGNVGTLVLTNTVAGTNLITPGTLSSNLLDAVAYAAFIGGGDVFAASNNVLTGASNTILGTLVVSNAAASSNVFYGLTYVENNLTVRSNLIANIGTSYFGAASAQKFYISAGQVGAPMLEVAMGISGNIDPLRIYQIPSIDLFGINSNGVVTAYSNVLVGGSVTVTNNLDVLGTMTVANLNVTDMVVTNSLGVGGAITGDTVVGTNGVRSAALTVATLPGSPVAGQMVWVSDAITSRGTGSLCTYNGTNWITSEDLITTTDDFDWTTDLCIKRLRLSTPFVEVSLQDGESTGGLTTTSGGTGASTLASSGLDSRFVFWMDVGSTATGLSSTRSLATATGGPTAGTFMFANTCMQVTDLSSDSDEYFYKFGAAQYFDDTILGDGAYFLYDRTNVFGLGIVATNNWVCITGNGAAATVTETAVPVVADTWTTLRVVWTTTNAVFAINGTPVATNVANLPTGTTLYYIVSDIVKTNGTTETAVYHDYLYTGRKTPTAR